MIDHNLTLEQLVECCRDLVEWSLTGKLNQQGVFKLFVDTNEHIQKINTHHRLSVAESVIKYAAMEKLVEFYDRGKLSNG